MMQSCKKNPQTPVPHCCWPTSCPVSPSLCRLHVSPSWPSPCPLSVLVTPLCLLAAWPGGQRRGHGTGGCLLPYKDSRLAREQFLAGRRGRAYEVRGRGAERSHSHSWAASRRVTRARCSPEELEAANTMGSMSAGALGHTQWVPPSQMPLKSCQAGAHPNAQTHARVPVLWAPCAGPPNSAHGIYSALCHAGTITSLAAAWQLFRTCQ